MAVKSLPDSHAIAQDEALLLDVGIVLFDSGIDLVEEASAEYASVRNSEAVWFSSMLRQTLDSSKAWGLVRVLPVDQAAMDITITGKLVESNGESAVLDVTAIDSLGERWLDHRYEFRASQYSYNPELDLKQDPFQPLLTEIANNLYTVLVGVSPTKLLKIRQVSRLRFAQRFLPQMVDDYLRDDDGQITLIRAPAEGDPFMRKVDHIYARNQMFLDVVQDYYRVFNANMEEPYREWRKLSYKEVQYERQLREQSNREKLAGVALMAGGVLASVYENNRRDEREDRSRNREVDIGSYVALVSGGWLFAKSYEKEAQASLHAETLRELGVSLEGELAPSIVDLQDRTVTLSGTVDDQFTEWKSILQTLFDAEFQYQNQGGQPQAIDSSGPAYLNDSSE